jgi:hypothetical protein
MGELEHLLRIYGAIDRVVQEHPERRPAVARLLPVYRDPDVHWFDDFERWTAERADGHEKAADEPLQMLHDALGGLAKGKAPQHRMRARRLFALAAAAQAFPELRDPDAESPTAAVAHRALRHEVAPDGDDSKTLLEALRDLPRGDPDVRWQAKLDSGLLVNPHTIGPRPCSGRLVMVGEEPVATLTTEFEADIPFEDAKELLRPEKWEACSDFWCEMQFVRKKANDVELYHEVVSLDCPNRESTWTIQADLDFRFRDEPGLWVTDYRLADGLPQQDVSVDEGSLVIRDIGSADAPRVMVTTTKRVEFTGPVHGEALALIMCLLGYASVVEDLLSCAAGADDPYPGRRRRRAGSPDYGSMIKDIADRTATTVKDCVDEYVDAARASYDKIDEGTYTADAMVQDMASMWVRMLREGAAAMDRGLRGTGMDPRARPRNRSAR